MSVALFQIYLYLYLWVVVPGTLVGWLLHRYWRSTLAVPIAAEAFSLLPIPYFAVRFGFDEAKYILVATHLFLFVPMLLAVFTGYYGSYHIGKKAAPPA